MSLIREARHAEGLTQAQLGARLGISQPSVARIESAGDNVTVATLRRALIAMGRDLDMRMRPLPEDRLLEYRLKMTPEQRLAYMRHRQRQIEPSRHERPKTETR